MKWNGLGQDSINSVHDCATSHDGQSLLNDLGDETHSLNPKLSGVPWITFNGVCIGFYIIFDHF